MYSRTSWRAGELVVVERLQVVRPPTRSSRRSCPVSGGPSGVPRDTCSRSSARGRAASRDALRASRARRGRPNGSAPRARVRARTRDAHIGALSEPFVRSGGLAHLFLCRRSHPGCRRRSGTGRPARPRTGQARAGIRPAAPSKSGATATLAPISFRSSSRACDAAPRESSSGCRPHRRTGLPPSLHADRLRQLAKRRQHPRRLARLPSRISRYASAIRPSPARIATFSPKAM